ncbi:adenosine receptor A2b-like [Tubulanus polymorphus]|uniref:adenosine receptor A2b-like n=1 Tax=Tubulanus polymorphus TaxID=672921 RepID=UPI003DA46FDC
MAAGFNSSVTRDQLSGVTGLNVIDILCIVLNGITMVITLSGNFIVIVCALKYEILKVRPANYFSFSLAVADLGIGLSLAMEIATLARPELLYVKNLCVFRILLMLISMLNSVFCLLCIVCDRVVCIYDPLHYHLIMTRKRCLAITSVTWLTSLLQTIPAIFWNVFSPQRKCYAHDFLIREHLLVIAFQPILGVIVQAVCYGWIATVAWQKIRDWKSTQFVEMPDLPVTDDQGKTTPPANAGQTGDNKSKTTRPKRLFAAFEKEIHLTKNMCLLVGLFAVCWLPLCSITIYDEMVTSQPTVVVHSNAKRLTLPLSVINSAINPCIYAWKLPEYRAAIFKLFRRSNRQRRLFQENAVTEINNSSEST